MLFKGTLALGIRISLYIVYRGGDTGGDPEAGAPCKKKKKKVIRLYTSCSALYNLLANNER
jgi:hypothetical protein